MVVDRGVSAERRANESIQRRDLFGYDFLAADSTLCHCLYLDKGMSQRIGVAPLAAAVPVVSEKIREEREREKIRVERQKLREKERRFKDKDAAMGKKSKITTDRDHDISEKIDLGCASTNEQGTMVYDERLFSLDTGMSSGLCSTPCNEKGE